MKVYVKELGKGESIQILNTSTDNFSMPRVGDTILASYTVVRVEWSSFRSGNGSAILWVIKKADNLVKVSILKKVKNGIWATDNLDVLKEEEIERTQLNDFPIPKVGEKLEIEEKKYMILEVIKVGDLFKFDELKVIVNEL